MVVGNKFDLVSESPTHSQVYSLQLIINSMIKCHFIIILGIERYFNTREKTLEIRLC